MATTHEAFASRLRSACEERGIKARGRAVTLAKIVGVSKVAAGNWLTAASIPTMANISTLSANLGVNANWMLTGVDDASEGVAGLGSLTLNEVDLIKRFRILNLEQRALAMRIIDAIKEE